MTARSALVLAGALLLLGAGEPGAELGVEHVDDSAYPDISVVVSAPHLGAEDPRGAFRVLEGGAALPVRTVAVPPDAVEVVLLVDTLAPPGVGVAQVRSAVMDLMLRLPPAARVSLVAAADPPEVVAEPGTALQARMVAASELTRGGRPALGEALALGLRQFSYAEGTVRSMVVVGDADLDGEAVPGGLARRIAQRQVTVHVVRPAAGAAAGADPIVERLANLYRLAFELRGEAREVDVHVVAGGRSATTTVALGAPPGARAPARSRAAGDAGGAGTAGGLRWPSLPLATVAIAVILALSAGIALPAAPAGHRGSTPDVESWERAAARVARETGADPATLEAAASGIARQRQEAASRMRATGREARLAAAVMAVQPLVAGAFVLLFSRGGYRDLFAGAWRPAGLLVAVVLTAAGAVWLRRVARPPFSASPARWQAHDREAAAWQEAADTLDRAHLYAAGGLALDEALARAGADASGPEHPARRSLEAHGTGGAPAAEALAAAGAAIRAERLAAARRQAQAVSVATAVPFLACVLPATILVVVAGWPALATG